MKTETTFRRGGKAIVAASDLPTLQAQAAAALSGGPVPMPSHWVGFDPAAVPQYRPGLICVTCGRTFNNSDSDRHFSENLKVRSGRVTSRHEIHWLPPIQDA